MNNNNLNLSDDKVNSLLQLAAKKLGTDPNQLKQQLQSGSLDGITDKLDAKSTSQLNNFLQNPKAAEKLLGSDTVQSLLGNLNQGKK